jgi:hypothetical protein
VALALVSAVILRSFRKASAQKKHEADYSSALELYSKNLPPGMLRKDVEDYLRAKQTSFLRFCGFEQRGAFADLVRVGDEDPPWFCREAHVYIAIEFTAPESTRLLSKSDDMDMLKKIGIQRRPGGCL